MATAAPIDAAGACTKLVSMANTNALCLSKQVLLYLTKDICPVSPYFVLMPPSKDSHQHDFSGTVFVNVFNWHLKSCV